jgi:MFS family permease
MLGGSAGQFISAPLLKNGLGLAAFWIIIGILSLIIGGFVLGKTPKEPVVAVAKNKTSVLHPYKIVFSNIQSYLCGIVSGLLFAPTTVFAMTWGVAFFQSGRGLDYTAATIACAIVPIGWAIGCPLMGWLADKTGSRKKVLALGAIIMALSLMQLAWLPGLLPPYITMLILGIASGVAMLPYAIIKEVNPDSVKGSATGAINFITFGVTSLLGPLFSYLYGNSLLTTADKEAHFAGAGLFFAIGIAFALVVTIFLKETGVKKA